MDGNRFDRLTRTMGGTSRRGVLRTLAAGAAGGLGIAAFGRDARAQKAFKARLQDLSLEEQAIVLYEGLAEIADAHGGSCEELGAKTQDFITTNADLYAQVQAEQEAWTHEQRIANAETYGDRLEAATKSIHFARARCGYVPSDGVADTPLADCSPSIALGKSAPSLQTCDCDSNCPISTGHCIGFGLACAGGSPCACCWASDCGKKSHCENNCAGNECCGTACSQMPSDGGADDDGG